MWTLTDKQLTPTVVNNIREATHNIVYTIVNSNAMNGVSTSSKIVAVTPTWKYWLTTANIVLGLAVLWAIVFVTRRSGKQKKTSNVTLSR